MGVPGNNTAITTTFAQKTISSSHQTDYSKITESQKSGNFAMKPEYANVTAGLTVTNNH